MAHLLLYGGTFDPIHHGHLIACRAAREVLGADGVVLIPAWVSPHKTGRGAHGAGGDTGVTSGAGAGQRLEMVRMAIAGEAGFSIDERELVRGAAEGKPSYTVDTVAELVRERPGDRLTLLLGSDQLPKLHTWHEVQRLFSMVEGAVLGRPSESAMQVELEAARHRLGAAGGRLRALATPLIEISGTEIRQRVREGRSIAYLVPERVREYIGREGLYGGA